MSVTTSPSASTSTREVTVSIDGVVVPAHEARVSVLDHGFTVGDGVFETCRVVDGHAVAWSRHLRRLGRSMAILGLAPIDPEAVTEALQKTLDAAPRDDSAAGTGRVRLTVTSGRGPLGSGRGESKSTLVVVAAPAAPWPGEIRVVTVPWPRNERSALLGAKTTSYAENVVAVEAARLRGASEALMANLVGQLCEGTGSNVAVGVGGELITPPLSSGCLAGITRELLLEWAREEGLPVVEGELSFDVLAAAEDLVIMSSTRDVQRVHVLDDRRLSGGALGEAAIEMFARRIAADPQA